MRKHTKKKKKTMISLAKCSTNAGFSASILVCGRESLKATWVGVEHPTVPSAEIFAALTPQQLNKVSASQMSQKESNFDPLRNGFRAGRA